MSESTLTHDPEAQKLAGKSQPRRGATRPGSRRRTAVGQAAVAALGVHLLVAPMLLGGIFPWSMTLTAATALGCLAVAAYACDVLDSRTAPLIWVAFALLAWTALQATPLPIDFVRALAPASASNAEATHRALGWPAPTWCALSRDPGATQQEIVKGTAIVATLLAAWLLAAKRGRRQIFWTVALSTTAMSLVALAHGILQMDRVFGFYKPLGVGHLFVLAPIMNLNSLGAFTALGVPIWIGLTHRHQSHEVRWLGRIATVINSAASLLSLSRGATVQLCVSLLIMLGLVFLSARRAQKKAAAARSWSTYGLVATITVAGAFVALIGGARVADQLGDRDFSKLKLIGRSFQFVADHPWIGVGRGAFSSAFVGVEGSTMRFAHVENFVAQWVNEWGVPFTGLWLFSAALALVLALRGTTSLARLGAATGLAGLCAQNLVDLGLELLGVAVVAAALLGALIVPDQPRTRAQSMLGSARFSVALLLAAGVAALLVLGPRLPQQAVTSLEARLRSSMQANDRPAFRATLARAVNLHPSEPRFAVLASTEALTHLDPNTSRWLNRAMQLAPHWGAPHLLAYQWLWKQGRRSQALLEFRQAAEADENGTLMGDHVCGLARLRGEWVIEAAPRGARRRAFLESAANCVDIEHRSAEVLDDALIREFPESPVGHERAAYRLARQGLVDESLAQFARLLHDHPRQDSARVVRAEILLGAGRHAETVEIVDKDLPLVQAHNRRYLLQRQAHAYARMGDESGVQRSLSAFRRQMAASAEGLADSYALEGYVQLELRHSGAAFGAFREAYRINQDTKHLKVLAQLAGQFNDRPQQLWAYARLCEREPGDASNCAHRDRLLRSAAAP